ncbi:MAG: polysaccharide deacetylase family protein [Ferruginibacter sp.]|nr:polysaccharide deacetylase family protein [Ferruginibacter sp.]
MNLLIVNFHYFRDQKYDSGIYPITPKQFEHQVNLLSRRYQFISQEKLASWVVKGKQPTGDYCLLTFDDGLKEQMNAYEWLHSQKIPAVFYIPTNPIKEKSVLTVHKLHLLRTRIADQVLLKEVEAKFEISFDQSKQDVAAGQYRYDDPQSQKLKYLLNFSLTETQKKEFVDQSFYKLFGDETRYSENFYMNENDIRKISVNGMVGSHGASHQPLATLSQVEMIDDIKNSTQFLQNLTQQQILSFSYPYGSKAAVTEQVASIVEENGYRFALTMWRGMNSNAELARPFLLHRFDTNDVPGGKKNEGDANAK